MHPLTINHFFHQPIKNKEETFEKFVEMSRNVKKLIRFFIKIHKLIGIDLSRQTNTSITQQLSFIGKLEK